MKEDNKIITFAIHSYDKAMNVKNILEKEGITVVVEELVQQQPFVFKYARLKINETDLCKAISLVDNINIVSPAKAAKSVLIPVDFSEYSKNACKIGFEFAEKYNMTVVLLHTFLNQVYSNVIPIGELLKMEKDSIGTGTRRDTAIAAKIRMEEFVSTVKSLMASGDLPNVRFETEVIEGVPEDVILDYAKLHNPTIIVMGTRGIHRKEKDMIGSVTAEVLDSTRHLLFIVPEHISTTDVNILSNIVFYTNLEQTDLSALDIFLHRLDVSKMHITILHIDNKRETMIEEKLNGILTYCEDHYEGIDFDVKLIKSTDYMEEFEQFLNQNKTDVVVIPNKRRNMFSRIFNPSLAHRMLFQKDIPMLVVPIK